MRLASAFDDLLYRGVVFFDELEPRRMDILLPAPVVVVFRFLAVRTFVPLALYFLVERRIRGNQIDSTAINRTQEI